MQQTTYLNSNASTFDKSVVSNCCNSRISIDILVLEIFYYLNK